MARAAERKAAKAATAEAAAKEEDRKLGLAAAWIANEEPELAPMDQSDTAEEAIGADDAADGALDEGAQAILAKAFGR